MKEHLGIIVGVKHDHEVSPQDFAHLISEMCHGYQLFVRSLNKDIALLDTEENIGESMDLLVQTLGQVYGESLIIEKNARDARPAATL